ncbi:hypothetical protein GCM10022252_70600 [Streptosporangium oxazolinicum]|uniref:Uncharacterized protein n=1 Tax=Streptosporangium oxazolinicum TaxID=909287 RepID=A0ABP8BHS3_9ACTN
MNDKPNISKAQATTRVEELVRTAVAEVKPVPNMKLSPTSLADRPCIPDEGNVLTGEIYVIRSYYLTGIPKEHLVEVARKIQTNWKNSGHKITNEYAFDRGKPQLSGRTSDDFRLALDTVDGESGLEISLLVGSPCFRPDKPSPSPT